MSDFQSYQSYQAPAVASTTEPNPPVVKTEVTPAASAAPIVPKKDEKVVEPPKPVEGQETPKVVEKPKEEPKPGEKPEEKPGEKKEEPKADKPEWQFQKFTDEWTEKGALSEESYAALQKDHGLSKLAVDAYIAGQKALQSAEASKATADEAQSIRDAEDIHAVVGGADNYAELSAWAATNLPAEEVDAFNETLEKGSVAQIKTALKGILATYNEANGVEPTLVTGNPAVSDVKPYETKADMKKDMLSPDYKKSQAFRDQVAARLQVSNII